jgi:hypothetical protein
MAVSGDAANNNKKMHDDVLKVGDGERSPRIKRIRP